MSSEFLSAEVFKEAADFIRTGSEGKPRPRVGLILGSGLSTLADEVKSPTVIPFGEIPHFPVSGVLGHAGRLVLGELEGQQVVVMQGRVHFYEGHSPQVITLPVRVMKLLGVEILIVTNAAGGINRNFAAGDLMLITDHINFVGLAGNHPLRGPNLEEFGTRFPSLSAAYDMKLQRVALEAAKKEGIRLQKGVYAFVAGPSFETPAELRMLQAVGADAVGMSTVPETIVARHAGMRVLGISSITNVCILEPAEEEEATHEEVLEAGKLIVPRLMVVIKGVLKSL